MCLIGNHIAHGVVDIVKEQKEKRKDVVDRATALIEHFSRCKDTLFSAKQEVHNKCEQTLCQLQEKKAEVVKMFDALISQANLHKESVSRQVENKMEKINDGLRKLKQIKERKIKEMVTSAELNLEMESMSGIERDVIVKDTKAYRYYEYKPSTAGKEKWKEMCGELVEEEIALRLPWQLVPEKFYAHGKYRFCFSADGRVICISRLQ